MDISDITTMRALAHPLRFELLDIVASYGPITATRCSERAGESPSNCSFHLRVLARAGLIEEVPGGTGRDRLWRCVDSTHNVTPDTDDPVSMASAKALSDAQLQWEIQRIRMSGLRRGAAEWDAGTRLTGSTLYLTREEAAGIVAAVDAILQPYRRRANDPTGPGEDERRPIRMFFASSLVDDGPLGDAAYDGPDEDEA